MLKTVNYTYTVAVLDDHGRVSAYISSPVNTPEEALEVLREKQKSFFTPLGVMKSVMMLMDEAGLRDEIEKEKKNA